METTWETQHFVLSFPFRKKKRCKACFVTSVKERERKNFSELCFDCFPTLDLMKMKFWAVNLQKKVSELVTLKI